MYYDIYILSSLMQEPMYGYQIRKNLQHVFSACTRISNNSLYPLLKKFKESGYITQSEEAQVGKPTRIVYSITRAGKEFFLLSLNTINDAVRYNRDDFFMRLLYFHLIRPPVRKLILNNRLEYLLGCMETAKKVPMPEKKKDPSKGIYEPRSGECSLFFLGFLQSEMDLIRSYIKRIDEPCLIPRNLKIPPEPPGSAPGAKRRKNRSDGFSALE
jgi:DNA-binding PadR family transcriptional regulator